MHWLLEASLSSLREGAVFNLITFAAAGAAVYFASFRFFDAMGLALLLEATGLMLAGGAMELGAAPSSKRLVSILQGKPMDWTRKDYTDVQKRAAIFTITGIFLFAESLLMAVLAIV